MQYSEIKTDLGIDSDIFADDWDLSAPSQSGVYAFITKESVQALCEALMFENDIRDAFINALPLFDSEPVRRLFWHCHWLMFKRGVPYPRDRFVQWPLLTMQSGDHADMFYAFLFLSGALAVSRAHEALRIPRDVTVETLSDLAVWMRTHRERTGRIGISEKNWLYNHYTIKLFRLGRLQFLFEEFPHSVTVYRSRAHNGVVMLAPADVKFRRDGQYDGIMGVADPKAATTSFEETDNAWKGNTITPEGGITAKTATLKKSEWDLILKKGDPALSFHIAATGPMDHAQCGESFARARDFYPRHFPEYGSRCFFSVSWLYDHQFDGLLPDTSNIVKLQRELFLYPLPEAGDKQHWERIFGKRYENINDAPQNTSLQKTFAAHVKNGGHWRSSGALLFPEDIRWGSAVYREKR
ncbi:MAG: DUF5596 domain-containing protein [Spirochaetes bacterium]|nr:DUF5596 domain-containing protein [Spirochaetota bacterium]